jgi:hypothetical protein
VPDAIKKLNVFSAHLDFSSMQTPVSMLAHTQQTLSTECANARPESFIKTNVSPAVQVDLQPFQDHAKNATHPASNAASRWLFVPHAIQVLN